MNMTEQQMCQHFNIPKQIEQDSLKRCLHVNHVLEQMSDEQITETIKLFGFVPVRTYFVNQIQPQKLEGFIQYVDTYLLEKSGGNRAILQQLAYDILRLEIQISTSRAMRLQILHQLFAPYQI